MKIIILSLLIILPLNCALALDLYLKVDAETTKTIRVSELEGVSVSSECTLSKKHCLKLMNKAKLVKMTKTPKDTVGNPASEFCHAANGKSSILEDAKHNEYDYCVLENKYYIDSWQFYKKYNK